MHCNSLQPFMFSVDNYSYFMVILLYFKMHIAPFGFYITKNISDAIIHTCLYQYRENGQLFVFLQITTSSIQDDHHHLLLLPGKVRFQTITLTG